jgi:hypothetical protein
MIIERAACTTVAIMLEIPCEYNDGFWYAQVTISKSCTDLGTFRPPTCIDWCFKVCNKAEGIFWGSSRLPSDIVDHVTEYEFLEEYWQHTSADRPTKAHLGNAGPGQREIETNVVSWASIYKTK